MSVHNAEDAPRRRLPPRLARPGAAGRRVKSLKSVLKDFAEVCGVSSSTWAFFTITQNF
jgi:hypothetical protein